MCVEDYTEVVDLL